MSEKFYVPVAVPPGRGEGDVRGIAQVQDELGQSVTVPAEKRGGIWCVGPFERPADAPRIVRASNDRRDFIDIAYEAMNPWRMHGVFTNVAPNLESIVGKNQNHPPLGEADGSFTEEQWTAARDFAKALRELERNFLLVLDP